MKLDLDKWIKKWKETHSPEDSETIPLSSRKVLKFKSERDMFEQGYIA